MGQSKTECGPNVKLQQGKALDDLSTYQLFVSRPWRSCVDDYNLSTIEGLTIVLRCLRNPYFRKVPVAVRAKAV